MELLTENLGQPGFRELLLVVHDLDARQDAVFAFLAEAHRPRFPAVSRLEGIRSAPRRSTCPASRATTRLTRSRRRWHCPRHRAPPRHLRARRTWRGETHRLCDRPAALTRVLEEVAAAGAEQVILLAATPRVARPHELSATRADVRGEAGEQLAAFESAGLRDVLEQFTGRFAGLYVIRPDTIRSLRSISTAFTTNARSPLYRRRARRPGLRGRLPAVHRSRGRRQWRADAVDYQDLVIH